MQNMAVTGIRIQEDIYQNLYHAKKTMNEYRNIIVLIPKQAIFQNKNSTHQNERLFPEFFPARTCDKTSANDIFVHT